MEKILGAVDILQDFSNTGRVVLEFSDRAFRERLVYSYRINDRLQGNAITVAAVVHGKRLIASFE